MGLFGNGEKDIIRALQNGADIEKMTGKMYEKYYHYLKYYLIKKLNADAEQADDHVQDAFILVLRHIQLGKYNPDGTATLKTYLTRVAVNCFLKHGKQEARRSQAENVFTIHRPLSMEITLQEDVQGTERQELSAMEKFLRLEERCRQLLLLVYQGVKPKDIQLQLGIETEGNVRVRKMRCLKKLLK